ncbi:hypothetical protein R1sor_014666 [Riccia sorocarpa]|uniref:Reverse transcriptase domain-containing protein n=1 Tax=Riccia sorocarpa TaxID=122646 RepID=A0ABD3HCN1_9MARC
MDRTQLQNEAILQEVKTVWDQHPSWAADERKRWGMALARVQHDQTEEAKKLFEEALVAARRREQLDTRISRIRCRIKWLKDGDASTRFFFACLKAKNKREEITAVKLQTGEVITDEAQILSLIEETYGELYSAEDEGPETVERRGAILQMIDKRFSEEQNRHLEENPTDEFIEEIVRSLPRDKAPRFDGVTIEVLVAGWDFMRLDCLAMVRRVWRSSRLLSKDNRGIIKLIPKADELFLLKNWRPITLLTTTYKIVAKIFAWRLKMMLPDIIDQQQIGFIAGRSIVDNILSLRMAHEWVPVSSQEVMFVKLDFQKAYDRVSHSYLWDTLSALGMSDSNVRRIQGLVTGGAAQVHVNGKFTRRFEVTRGVRQGCPLAPLLFAMVTQPLMRMFREEEAHGRLLGVNYGGHNTLLHQIYADDTGVNLTMKEDHFNRLLAWPAKIILLKQVLAATPLYQLLSVSLEQAGLDKLETLCRQFLWGWVDLDHPKAAMIAWKRVSQGRKEGGLGWVPLQVKARALQVKNLMKIMMGAQAEWVHLAKSLILRTLRSGRYQRESRQGRIADILLLSSIVKIQGSRTLTRMWTAWSAVRKTMSWDDRCIEIPDHLNLQQGIRLMHWGDRIQTAEYNKITGILRRAGIGNVTEGKAALGEDGGWTDKLIKAGCYPEEAERRKIELVEDWLRSKTLVRKDIHEVDGWVWAGTSEKIKWDMTTKEWTYRFMVKRDFTEYLNQKWGCDNTTIQWTKRWTTLWNTAIHYRRKAWIWRFLQRGYFTGSRGKGWSADQQQCLRCGSEEETLEDVFWDWNILRRRIEEMRAIGVIPAEVSSILDWIDRALDKAKEDSSYIWAFGAYLVTTWSERNDLRFRGRRTHRPLRRCCARFSWRSRPTPPKPRVTASSELQGMQEQGCRAG